MRLKLLSNRIDEIDSVEYYLITPHYYPSVPVNIILIDKVKQRATFSNAVLFTLRNGDKYLYANASPMDISLIDKKMTKSGDDFFDLTLMSPLEVKTDIEAPWNGMNFIIPWKALEESPHQYEKLGYDWLLMVIPDREMRYDEMEKRIHELLESINNNGEVASGYSSDEDDDDEIEYDDSEDDDDIWDDVIEDVDTSENNDDYYPDEDDFEADDDEDISISLLDTVPKKHSDLPFC